MRRALAVPVVEEFQRRGRQFQMQMVSAFLPHLCMVHWTRAALEWSYVPRTEKENVLMTIFSRILLAIWFQTLGSSEFDQRGDCVARPLQAWRRQWFLGVTMHRTAE